MQLKISFKSKSCVSTARLLKLMHMDLFGSTRILSLRGKIYGLVIIDDYSRYTWAFFLAYTCVSFRVFEVFCKRIQRYHVFYIPSIKSDNDTEFKNGAFKMFCESNGIHHNFSSSRTPHQNAVME